MKNLKSLSYVFFALVLILFASCSGDTPPNPSSDKDITVFTIPSQIGTTVITDTSTTAGTIAVTVPFDTARTALVATFTTTGSSVTVGTTAQVSGTTANNFTSPVTYTVTAADGTTKAYIVAVTPAPPAAAPPAAGDKVTFTADGVSFKMAYVPGGKTFPTGTDDLGSATVDNAYWIGETEVTYELWDKVYDWATTDVGGGVRVDGGVLYTFANTGVMGSGTTGTETPQHPVTTINWRDTMIFSNALTEWYNANNGTDANYSCVYYADAAYTTPIRKSTNSGSVDPNPGSEDDPYVNPNATGFRMLTSNEWELAARWRNDATNTVAPYTNPYFTKGNSASGATADYNNAEATVAVAWYNPSGTTTGTNVVKGTIPRTANALGLYDMSGNVWELNFDYPSFSGSDRVLRGGGWDNGAFGMQVGYVDCNDPYNTYYSIGFRLSRTDL